MTGCVGVDLRPVQANFSQLEQLHFPGDLRNLHKQVGQFVQEAFAELGQGRVIGMVTAREVTESQRIVVNNHFHLAAGKDARGIAIEQEGQQERRMV